MMTVADLQQKIDLSTGKWSKNISDIDYTFLKNAAENAEDETFSDDGVEKSLANVPIPTATPTAPAGVAAPMPTKKHWLKKAVCTVVNDVANLQDLDSTDVQNIKQTLLQKVLDYITTAVPGLAGVALNIVEKIVVFLLKQLFNAIAKGINNWCTA
jgi:hypothetical protein